VYFEAIGSEQVLQTFFDFVFGIKIVYYKTTFESIYTIDPQGGGIMKKSKNVFAKFIYISNKKTKKKKKSNS